MYRDGEQTRKALLPIFCAHLDILGIAWTRSQPHAVQVARRTAVDAMDRFVGPKA